MEKSALSRFKREWGTMKIELFEDFYYKMEQRDRMVA